MKWLNCSKVRLILVGFLAAMVMGALAQAATITVGPGAGYDFDTIQAGIDEADDEDTVLVAPGEYVVTEPITFRGKAITVRAEAGRDETTIRMGTPADPNRGSVVIFENGETIASVLDGFTITGGIGCRFWNPEYSEFHWWGGGIFFNASSGTMRNCAIVQNRAEDIGGGVALAWSSSAILTDCIIDRNVATAENGGGVCCVFDSSVTMTDCIIRGNTTEGVADCAGVTCAYNSSGTLTNCTIVENSAAWAGGGVCCWYNSSMTLTNCTIAENSAARYGGGLCSGENSPTTFINCTIWGNSAGTSGGGLGCYNGASATVTNSILWGNMTPTGRGDEIYLECHPTIFSITYSNVAGGQAGVRVESASTLNWGDGNIDVDPCFAGPNNHDFHVKSEAGRWDPNSESWVVDGVTSPCIDAGDPMSPIGLEPFPNGGFVNVGAYGGTPEASKSYFGEPVCETIVAGDINGDCKVDFVDFMLVASHWLADNNP